MMTSAAKPETPRPSMVLPSEPVARSRPSAAPLMPATTSTLAGCPRNVDSLAPSIVTGTVSVGNSLRRAIVNVPVVGLAYPPSVVGIWKSIVLTDVGLPSSSTVLMASRSVPCTSTPSEVVVTMAVMPATIEGPCGSRGSPEARKSRWPREPCSCAWR